jgi:hypothetical protein
VFSESYAAAPIGKATADQLRLALLAAEQKMVNRQTGEIQLFGARYWSEDCARLGLHGQRVTVRFDPDDLSRPVHLYDLEGRYLCSAEAWNDVPFDSADAAKQTAKFMAEKRRDVRKAEEAEQFLAAPSLAAAYLGLPDPITAKPKAKVVRAVRHRGQTAAALKLVEMPAAAPRRDHESKVFEAMGEAYRRLRAVEAEGGAGQPRNFPRRLSHNRRTGVDTMNDPTNQPIDIEEMRQWLITHKQTTGLSWSELAKRTGVAAGTISQFGSERGYAGDETRVAETIYRYRQHLPRNSKSRPGAEAPWLFRHRNEQVPGLHAQLCAGRPHCGGGAGCWPGQDHDGRALCRLLSQRVPGDDDAQHGRREQHANRDPGSAGRT